jgi:hypothetical protein
VPALERNPRTPFKNTGLWAGRAKWENPITHETCLALDIPNADYDFFDKKSFR